jgi:hypothetical protein
LWSFHPWVFWKTGYLDLALIKEVVEPNILVLEIYWSLGNLAFALIEELGKI